MNDSAAYGAQNEIKYVAIKRVKDAAVLLVVASPATKKAYADEVSPFQV